MRYVFGWLVLFTGASFAQEVMMVDGYTLSGKPYTQKVISYRAPDEALKIIIRNFERPLTPHEVTISAGRASDQIPYVSLHFQAPLSGSRCESSDEVGFFQAKLEENEFNKIKETVAAFANVRSTSNPLGGHSCTIQGGPIKAPKDFYCTGDDWLEATPLRNLIIQFSANRAASSPVAAFQFETTNVKVNANTVTLTVRVSASGNGMSVLINPATPGAMYVHTSKGLVKATSVVDIAGGAPILIMKSTAPRSFNVTAQVPPGFDPKELCAVYTSYAVKEKRPSNVSDFFAYSRGMGQ